MGRLSDGKSGLAELSLCPEQIIHFTEDIQSRFQYYQSTTTGTHFTDGTLRNYRTAV
jgi:hypothetical protein